jgi:hypothetical protein
MRTAGKSKEKMGRGGKQQQHERRLRANEN